jgi:hypothetical protein
MFVGFRRQTFSTASILVLDEWRGKDVSYGKAFVYTIQVYDPLIGF